MVVGEDEADHPLSAEELSRCERLLLGIDPNSGLKEVADVVRTLLQRTDVVIGQFGSQLVPARALHDVLSFRLQNHGDKPPPGLSETVARLKDAKGSHKLIIFGHGDPKTDVEGWDATLYVSAESDQIVGLLLFQHDFYAEG